MKQLIVLFACLSLLAACVPSGQNESLTRNMGALSDEMLVLQNTITDLQTAVDDLTLKNEALSQENSQSAETITELQTEVTYLSNELTILKSSKPAAVVSTPSVSATPSTTTPLVSAPKIVIIEDVDSMKDSMYNYAMELYKQGKHSESIERFSDFISKLPKDDLAENAQYWIGENYYSMHNYTRALQEFRKVLSAYHSGRKAPDALLKAGYSEHYLKRNDDAKKTLNEVISKYPKSDAAALAKRTLTQW